MKKQPIIYTFENPNTSLNVERILKKILLEKLQSLSVASAGSE